MVNSIRFILFFVIALLLNFSYGSINIKPNLGRYKIGDKITITWNEKFNNATLSYHSIKNSFKYNQINLINNIYGQNTYVWEIPEELKNDIGYFIIWNDDDKIIDRSNNVEFSNDLVINDITEKRKRAETTSTNKGTEVSKAEPEEDHDYDNDKERDENDKEGEEERKKEKEEEKVTIVQETEDKTEVEENSEEVEEKTEISGELSEDKTEIIEEKSEIIEVPVTEGEEKIEVETIVLKEPAKEEKTEVLEEKKIENIKATQTKTKNVRHCPSGISLKPWTSEQQTKLEEALNKFPSSQFKENPMERWYEISNYVGRSRTDIKFRIKDLAESVRRKKSKTNLSLQN